MHASLRITSALRFGLRTMSDNFIFYVQFFSVVILLYLLIITSVYAFALIGITEQTPILSTIGYILGNMANICIGIWITFAGTKAALLLVDGQKPTIKGLLLYFYNHPRIFAIAIISTFIFMGLALFLIIPGIIWAIATSMYHFCFYDGYQGIKESFQRSIALTKGHYFKLFLLGISSILLSIFFFFIPVTQLAYASIYRQLSPRPESPVL
jgi:hypothetical protein